MKREDTIALNTHAVVRRVELLGLKQAWLALAVGVTAKTVGRWLSGRVTRIARENLGRLAAALECEPGDIALDDRVGPFATREQQRVAAALIQERDLLGLLSPSDNWRLAEGLIKATMQPNLPLRQLGMLYNLLSITSWRQGSYQEARDHADRAMELGLRVGDRGVIHRATANIATIESIVGSPAAALAAYEEALQRPEYFENRRDHAAALSNVSMVYRDFARFDAALTAQREAIAMYHAMGLAFNEAIAWMSMAQIVTELGRLDEGLRACDSAALLAAESGFERGALSVQVYRADCLSLLGDHESAVAHAEQGIAGLARYEVYDLMCNEIAVRTARRAGRLQQAGELYRRFEPAARPFEFLHARLLQEGARLYLADGSAGAANQSWTRAVGVMRALGLHERAARGDPGMEYGTLFEGVAVAGRWDVGDARAEV